MRKSGFIVNLAIAAILAAMSVVYLWHGHYVDAAPWGVLAVAFVSAGFLQNPNGAHSKAWTRIMYGSTIVAAAAFLVNMGGFLK